ncbi:MAG TPA: CHASE3 domain-containing protein, partial [Caulobacteraceae bacterium]|nr:CHASE3 domain-containing protein [Caulobacteraceae bacterium]
MLGFKRVIGAAVALALVVAGLGVSLLVTQLGTLGRARAWVNHSRAVIEAVQQLRSSVEDVQDGERGYLVTGDRAYLAPYLRASAMLPSQESQLLALVSDNPPQTSLAKTMVRAVEARRAIVDRVVADVGAGDRAAATA